jgi:hypothetical protein
LPGADQRELSRFARLCWANLPLCAKTRALGNFGSANIPSDSHVAARASQLDGGGKPKWGRDKKLVRGCSIKTC